MRFAVVRRECGDCREALKSINRINMRLPHEKRIKIFDNYLEEEFDIKMFPIIDRIEKEFFNYPFIYLDGIVVEPAIKELLTPYFKKFFKDDMLIKDEDES